MSGHLALDRGELAYAGFEPITLEGAWADYWSFRFGRGYELTIEPLLWNRWALALYEGRQLVMPAKLELPPRRLTHGAPPAAPAAQSLGRDELKRAAAAEVAVLWPDANELTKRERELVMKAIARGVELGVRIAGQ